MKALRAVALVLLAQLWGLAPAEAGQGARAVRNTMEASMLVPGTIAVDEQGHVEHYALERPDALPPEVTALLARAIPLWRFEPTLEEGRPAAVRTSMSIRVAANRLSADAFALRIAGASFGGWGDMAAAWKAAKNHPPRYPRAALRRGVTATVYLVGRVGLDGKMQEVVAEQVNLRVIAPERVMEDLREVFARASIDAAMEWTYEPPPEAQDVRESYWSVRVPVDFSIHGRRTPGHGEWDKYIPGPRHTASWLDAEDAGSPDSHVAGQVYAVGSGLKLLTPLDGGA